MGNEKRLTTEGIHFVVPIRSEISTIRGPVNEIPLHQFQTYFAQKQRLEQNYLGSHYDSTLRPVIAKLRINS